MNHIFTTGVWTLAKKKRTSEVKFMMSNLISADSVLSRHSWLSSKGTSNVVYLL
jgi:hypothetical protein